MITNLEGLTNFFVTWLQAQARKSGTVNACVGLSGGIDSAVVFALCVRAFPKTVGVLMPCQSSAESVDRAKEVVASQKALCDSGEIPGYSESFVVDLGEAFKSVVGQVSNSHMGPSVENKKFCEGSLRSCLRAPVLDYVSKCHNALVYGTGNRDEDAIFRYYQKRGDGAVDNNVIVGLHKSEVRQLATYLGLPKSVIDAVPTADLWGSEDVQTDEGELGLTYDEIEWVTRMNDIVNVLEERDCFDMHEDGYLRQWEYESEGSETYLPGPQGFAKRYAGKFTARQFEIIERAHKAEKATRHKAQLPPGPEREEINYFVV